MPLPGQTVRVQIEPASVRDVRTLNRLVKLCFGRDAWTWLDVLEALTLPGTVRLKAVSNGATVGFVIGDRRTGRLGWIASIGVHPDLRRQGIGRRLLLAAERALATSRVRLTLRRSNLAAFELYAGLGYREVDVWRRYYRDGEDGLVMERSPAPTASPDLG
jgi:ribosomal protein S18 acetylase RimI-like enzyme